MIQVNGLCGIYAKVLKHSICPRGIQFITFEISYPRLILAELNTHSMLSKNSASSRAIPFEKMKDNLTGRPVRFGQANPGMQDKGEDYDGAVLYETMGEDGYAECRDELPYVAWEDAKSSALKFSQAFYEAGYHKQVYNRLTEPFQMMKTVLSATEMANFWWLRDHEAADPTLAELARVMREATEQSTPDKLQPGEWHLPYVDTMREGDASCTYFIVDEHGLRDYLSLKDAKQVSTARCAAVSFRNIDYTRTKSKEVYTRLIGDARKHASAFEHQATPMEKPMFTSKTEMFGGGINIPQYPDTWQNGVSHMDRRGQLWSGKLRGWVALRKTIEGENVPGFTLNIA